MDAALGIVLEVGYDALAIKDVADAADYTPGALYRYFPSKDALLAGTVAHLVEKLGGALAELDGAEMHAVDSESAPLAAITRLCAAYREFSHREPNAYGLLATMLADQRILLPDADDAQTLFGAVERALTPLARRIAEAQVAGAIDEGDLRRRAALLFSSLHGTLQLWKGARVDADTLHPRALADELIASLLIGFGADRPSALAAVDATADTRLPPLAR